ncbi:MAG: hypothetical protein V2A77_07410 [Pseudomonadota bacterium]
MIAAWAPDTARQGTDWHLYLKASDPDCNSSAISVRVTQEGHGGGSQGIKLPASDRCGFAGQLTMRIPLRGLFGTRFEVEAWVEDLAGNSSAHHTFPVVIGEMLDALPPVSFQRVEFKRMLGFINVLRSPFPDKVEPEIGAAPNH